MPKQLVVQEDTTSVSVTGIVLRDATTGVKLTGQVAADLTARWAQEGSASASLTLSDLASFGSAYSSGGLKEDGATAQYRLDLPNALFASGGTSRGTVVISGTDILDYEIHVDLTTYDPSTQDKTGFKLAADGMDAVPGYV